MIGPRRACAAVATAAFVLAPGTARAWLFEEHANIGRLASIELDRYTATFDSLWSAARASSPAAMAALCENGRASPTHNRAWSCVDFGALPAAGGDHSCSPVDLWATVTTSAWFHSVYADVRSTERWLNERYASRVDAWHQGNLDLQQDDRLYLARAKNNNVHFVLARADETTIESYLDSAGRQGAPMNATAAYATYHLAALAAAARLGAGGHSPPDPELAVRVLATEAFALHFLEDSFSAGHFVGLHVGDAGTLQERAGTHDYYCENGLDARTWDGRLSYAAHGDGFLADGCDPNDDNRPVDSAGVFLFCAPGAKGTGRSDVGIAAAAAQTSLLQVLAVVNGEPLPGDVPAALEGLGAADVCSASEVSGSASAAIAGAHATLRPVLGQTPEPYRADPELPHFRSEFGVNLRSSSASRVGVAYGGQYDPRGGDLARLQGALQIGLGFGFGAEGLTTHASDGVGFVEGNVIAYGAEDYFGKTCSGCATAPTRLGWGIRLHLPFWAVPGDAILAAVLYAAGKPEMAIRSAQGSVYGAFERVHAHKNFSWQIVIGREAALHFSSAPGFRMTEVEAPLVQIGTRHLFSGQIGGEALVQLGGAVGCASLSSGSAPERDTCAFSGLLRFVFDGVYYP